MKAKVINTGEILDLYPYHSGYWIDLKTQYLYRESNIEFLPDTPEEVTIEGYVARDKDSQHYRDLGLHLFTTKPTRSTIFAEWQGLRGKSMLIDSNLFPEVTWDSEPKRVKITITPME